MIAYLVVLLPSCVLSNIWDNLFSKIRDAPEIQVETDFKTQFTVVRQDQPLYVTLDYHVGTAVATAIIEKELNLFFFVTRVQVASLQVDFKKHEAVLTTPINCKNYYYEVPWSQSQTESSKRNPLLIHYLNMLFEYSHYDNQHYFYVFNPDLLGQLDKEEFQLPTIGLWVDSQGTISQLTIDDTPVPIIQESSAIKVNCRAEPQKLDRGFLETLINSVVKNI